MAYPEKGAKYPGEHRVAAICRAEGGDVPPINPAAPSVPTAADNAKESRGSGWVFPTAAKLEKARMDRIKARQRAMPHHTHGVGRLP